MNRQSASEVRKDFAETIDRVRHRGERIILHRRGKDVAAIVPLEDLALIEAVEDRLDLEEAKRRLNDPNDKTFPYEEIRRELELA